MHFAIRYFLVAVTSVLVSNSGLNAQTVHRPLAHFLNEQTDQATFLPPVDDFLGWVDSDFTVLASIDYAGRAAAYLASQGINLQTTFSGDITERALPDGRALVTVNLRTSNAISWLAPLDSLPPGPNDTIFGFTPDALVANPLLPPALGDSHLKVVFKNTAPGAPLPDLITAFYIQSPPGFELISTSLTSSSFGLLSDGSRAKLTVAQVQPRGLKGAYSAEVVKLQRIGNGR